MVMHVHGVFRLQGASMRNGCVVYRATMQCSGVSSTAYEVLGRRCDGMQPDGTMAVISGTARPDHDRRIIELQCQDMQFTRASLLIPLVWFTLSGRVCSRDMTPSIPSLPVAFSLEVHGFIRGTPFVDVVEFVYQSITRRARHLTFVQM